MENLDYADELQELEKANEIVEEFVENNSSDDDLEDVMLITQEATTSLELDFFFNEKEDEELEDE